LRLITIITPCIGDAPDKRNNRHNRPRLVGAISDGRPVAGSGSGRPVDSFGRPVDSFGRPVDSFDSFGRLRAAGGQLTGGRAAGRPVDSFGRPVAGGRAAERALD
jgi:hypothetical protein